MQRLLEALRDFRHARTPSTHRANRGPRLPVNRLLHHRSLRVEWLEDRSLLSVAPTGVDLLPAWDSGILDNDDLTNLDNSAVAKSLQFEVAGTVAGATVTLYADGTAIGTATAAGTTTNITTDGAYDLTDGAHSITARQTEPASTESDDSPALPLTVDTIAPAQLTDRQIVKLLADDGLANDRFGCSVAIDGDTAIVGAYGDDDNGTDSGAAYIYENTESGWVQVAKFAPAHADDHFGTSVSISGGLAIVGASAYADRGAAYVFKETGTGWTQVAFLTAADGATGDCFGCSVSISGTTAIIGAYGDSYDRGSAYIFEDTGSGWHQVTKLTANDGTTTDAFGCSVSISGDTAVIGAYKDNQESPYANDSGSAYVFKNTVSGWEQVAKLTVYGGAYDYFGRCVSISGDTAIVGAYGDNETGIYSDSGSAYFFQDTGSGWHKVAKVTASDQAEGDYFGRSVSISGTVAVVGTPGKDVIGTDSGAAYVFENTGSGWNQVAKRTAEDAGGGAEFGWSVAISGSMSIIGAHCDNDKGTDSGSAYLFSDLTPVTEDTGASDFDQITNDTTPHVTWTFTEPVYFQNVDVTVLDPNENPLTPDSLVSWGSETLSVGFATPLAIDGEYTMLLSDTSTASDGAGNLAHVYNSIAKFTIDSEPPTVPALPDLQVGSDTGVSSTDDVTNNTTLSIDVTGSPYYRLFRDGVQISGDYATGSYTDVALADGTYEYTATAVDIAGNESAPSAPLIVTIDTVAPAAPSIPLDLQAASDSGSSDTDNFTNDATPTFDLSAGPYFRIYRDTVVTSSLYESGTTCTLPTQPSGTYDYTVTAVDAAGNESAKSPALAVTIDAVAPRLDRQIGKLLASDGAANDYFGGSVSIDGMKAIVGSYLDDDKGNNSGAIYIFEDTISGWVQIAKLLASDGAANDYFGHSVSITGNMAVVGAPYDDDKGSNSGSAYVFEDTGSGWIQVAKLNAADGTDSDFFGYSVSVSGSVAIIGAHGDDDKGSKSGSAYIFADMASGWTQVAKLNATDGVADDYFGYRISIDGNRAIIGAHQDDDKGSDSGSAYVFEDSGSGWAQVAKLTAADGAASDYFGQSVSIDGATAVIGAYGDDDRGTESGSAYVFEEAGSGWIQVAKLTAADGAAADHFGYGVSTDGNMAIIGAYWDDDQGSKSGSAYIFADEGFGWIQVAKLTAVDGAAYDSFGYSVSISGTTAIAGAYYDDDKDTDSGSAYVFNAAPLLAEDTGASAYDQITSDTTPELALTFSEPVYGQDSDVVVHDPNNNSVTPDSISGWETNTLAITFSTPLTVDGEYTVTLNGTSTIADAADNALNNGVDQTFTFTIETLPPPAPSEPDLASTSDTGMSDTDNLTNDNTPTFEAIGAPYFRLYRDGVQVSGDYEIGIYTDTVPSDGTYEYTVTAVGAAGYESAPSPALSVTIDTQAPTAPATAPDLVAASDSGVSDTDNLTNDVTPMFEAAGAPYFRLFCDGARVSGDYESGNAITAARPDGIYAYTATAVDAAGNESAPSAALGVTIDTLGPLHADEVAKLLAGDGAVGDSFGRSVAIDGGTAIVGAANEDDKGSSSGSAYVFEDTGSGWVQVAKLTAADGAADDEFGYSVSISGSVAIVGAHFDDDNGSGSGSAYIFEDTGSGWVQVAKLTAADGASYDYFGCSVSISGTTAIVGAFGDADNGSFSGAAYVFEDTGSGWTQIAKLTASDGAAGDSFGCNVSISGSGALVGAYGDDDKGGASGSAYVFEDTGSGWTQIAKLTADDGEASDWFGYSVSVSGTAAIVGAYRDDDYGSESGSAYVFEDTGSGWTQVAKLTAADGAVGDYFGYSVSIDGAVAVVGAYQDDDQGSGSGSAYVFLDTGTTWVQILKRTPDDGAASDYFGCSVSVGGGATIIGAYRDDDHGADSGSAYVGSIAMDLSDDTGVSATDGITNDTTPELVFTFNTAVYGSDSDVSVRDPNGDPVALGSITGWGTDTLSISLGVVLTLDGEYVVTFENASTITDAAGNALSSSAGQHAHFTLDTIAPTVQSVLVKGSAWDDDFLDWLDSEGLGDSTVARLGYRLPTGGAQLDTLAWGNLDTITIVFGEDAVVAQEDLALYGVNVPTQVIAGFNYDAANYIATWTFAQPIIADRLWISLADVVQDPAGNRLDGEWQNAASEFPSGDGTAGGDFRFVMNVLPGDANGDGMVGPADASIMAAQWGYAGGWAPGDFTGDGHVDSDDAAVLASHWGVQTPPMLPGDANHSGTVDEADAKILAANWGARSGFSPGDADRNGVVDQGDATILASNWGVSNATWQMGDFDGDGIVGPKDASILGAHWGVMSGVVTWADGDFDGDGVVGPKDASILGAHWGATIVPPTEGGSSETSLPAVASNVPLVGPLPAAPLFAPRRLIEPIGRPESAVPGVMGEPAGASSPEEAAAVCDTVLAEQYGPRAEPMFLYRQRLAWSHAIAQQNRFSHKDDRLPARDLAIDLLLSADQR
ncbi:MAG: hypothetical protein JW888_11665 [Pirellulales bacterium]|nr:hypothetical protein [Pirellulales bacterium]